MHTLNLKSLTRGFFSILLFGFVSSGFAANSTSAETGLLWKLEAPNGKVSYLFGTMHSDDRRINNFSPEITQALSDSDVFMMEALPPRDPSIFLMPEGKSLAEMLTEKEFDKVRELADFHSMHIEAAMRMKPWLLAVVFDLPKPQTPYAQDVQLNTLAQDKGKDVLGLEDASEHFAALDSFTLEEQLVMLRAVLKRSQKEKERDFESLIKAYIKGDLAKIAALDDKITGSILPKELWARMRTRLLDERNVRMTERIASIASERSAFIAVGASHLPGDNGLIANLKAAGYKVSPVKSQLK
ncbi:MAG TPA: TraB/GumN family protein [Methylophilaceae bacterium]|nr:TraB/GumN family protein [Methylophilaceae bacterium]